ncbi:Lamin-like protein [Linum perenne]
MSDPILVALCILISSAVASGTDHIVGDNKGRNPGINYTPWANNQTFYVPRRRSKTYLDFRVNKSGYDNCTTEGAAGNWSGGKDFVLLDKAKRYYIICGNGQCFKGMKRLPGPGLNKTHSDSAAPGLVGMGFRQALFVLFLV